MKKLIAVVALVCAGLTMAGCSEKKSTSEQRLEALDKVYKQGKEARSSMERRGVEATDASCADMYVSTDTDREGTYEELQDKQYQATRKQSYVNGCMNRPANATPSPTPSASSSASVAVSPAS
ncbi:hypothetical protein OOJ91_33705 [Micromonospora lupini]|uniref:hypothetical protein n=1 Tax=Micromonospora lupini TaxID=285679 RepID=UPI002257B35A|nr:hypothetical protein [Micromonospora lupini]MCX5070803.1 hypothetical protein [Micromonospora lupini]